MKTVGGGYHFVNVQINFTVIKFMQLLIYLMTKVYQWGVYTIKICHCWPR